MSLKDAAGECGFVSEWNRCAVRADIQYELEYLELEATHQTGEVALVHFDHCDGAVIKPVIIRPIDTERGAYYDLISPFEYGGPFITASPGKHNSIASAFQEAFELYCREACLVSEFLRFHPLLGAEAQWRSLISVCHVGDNIILNLDRPMAEIRSEYSRSQSRNIARALDNGASVKRVDLNKSTLNSFRELYLRSVERLHAREFYYFSSDYFTSIANFNDDQISLYMMDTPGDGCVSALLVVHGKSWAHSHLIGGLPDARSSFPQTLIYDAAAEDLMSRGRKLFHLGGAGENQSGIRFFKQGMSESRVPYFVGQKIYDQHVYDVLTSEREKSGYHLKDGYFPSYRDTTQRPSSKNKRHSEPKAALDLIQ